LNFEFEFEIEKMVSMEDGFEAMGSMEDAFEEMVSMKDAFEKMGSMETTSRLCFDVTSKDHSV
jgi:hypothetical protein